MDTRNMQQLSRNLIYMHHTVHHQSHCILIMKNLPHYFTDAVIQLGAWQHGCGHITAGTSFCAAAAAVASGRSGALFLIQIKCIFMKTGQLYVEKDCANRFGE